MKKPRERRPILIRKRAYPFPWRATIIYHGRVYTLDDSSHRLAVKRACAWLKRLVEEVESS